MRWKIKRFSVLFNGYPKCFNIALSSGIHRSALSKARPSFTTYKTFLFLQKVIPIRRSYFFEKSYQRYSSRETIIFTKHFTAPCQFLSCYEHACKCWAKEYIIYRTATRCRVSLVEQQSIRSVNKRANDFIKLLSTPSEQCLSENCWCPFVVRSIAQTNRRDRNYESA